MDGWGKLRVRVKESRGRKGALVHVHMVAVPGTVEEGTETVQHRYKNTISHHHHHHHHCIYSHYSWSLRECVETAHGIGTDVGVLVGIVQ